ncbi:hypothetical protein [Bosea sp. Root483D1]|uniref:hypothetical protein n=1 Tax=Bosea sp. Root483D1 TaxID=1736544 RepID=UPI000A8B2814|nr:hypothetical protein [Bosea sp. Root483D1]
MSLRAVGFVEDWLSRNLQRRTSGSACRTETPDNYAVHLLIAANGSGIPPEEIVGEFPDLIGVITAILAGSPLTLGEHWGGVERPARIMSCTRRKVSEDGVRK